MKLVKILIAAVVLITSCASLSPEGKLQAAQKTLLASVSLLKKARDAGYLEGIRLKKAQKLVKRANAAVKAWRHSVLTDKANGIKVQDRPDLSAVIFNALEQIKQYHTEEEKEKEKEDE